MTDSTDKKTIDMTPTWGSLMPGIIAVLQNGTPEGQGIAIAELTKAATALDAYNDHAKTKPVESFAANVAALSAHGFRFGTRAEFDAAGNESDMSGAWAVWDDAPGMGGTGDGWRLVGDDPAQVARESVFGIFHGGGE